MANAYKVVKLYSFVILCFTSRMHLVLDLSHQATLYSIHHIVKSR